MKGWTNPYSLYTNNTIKSSSSAWNDGDNNNLREDGEGTGEVYSLTHSEMYEFSGIGCGKIEKTEKTLIPLCLENVII